MHYLYYYSKLTFCKLVFNDCHHLCSATYSNFKKPSRDLWKAAAKFPWILNGDVEPIFILSMSNGASGRNIRSQEDPNENACMHARARGGSIPSNTGQPQNACTHHPCYEQIVSSSDMSPMLPVHRPHRSSKGLESEACVKILALRLMSWENLDPWPLRALVSPAVTQEL